MGKSFVFSALIVSAFCFSSVLGLAKTDEQFFVEGKIYCDPCRLEFETRLSHPLSGVKVSLECKYPVNGSLTYFNEGFTDENGRYSLTVRGDHQDEICELKTVKSTHVDCNEAMATKESDRVVLTTNMGVASMTRFVNALGFMKKDINPQCAQVVKELGLDDLQD